MSAQPKTDRLHGSSEQLQTGEFPGNTERKRERSPSEAFTDGNGEPSSGHKRQKTSFQLELDAVKLHEVLCDGICPDDDQLADSAHHGHPPSALYHDYPCLWSGDTQADHLRGLQPLYNQKEFLDEIGVLVRYKHDCAQYTAHMKHHFTNFAHPKLNSRAFRAHRPWYHILEANGPLSTPFTIEVEIMSSVVASGLSELASAAGGVADAWQAKRNLTSPFPWFFHHRRSLKAAANRPGYPWQDDASVTEALALVDLIEDLGKTEYLQAEQLFQNGFVDRRHFAKLFCAGEVIVAKQGGTYQAYMVEEVKDSSASRETVLSCWSWAFYDTFSKQRKTLKVPWPQGEALAPITDLPAYPIRYARDDMIQRLVDRGKMFWKCRTRRYIQYTAPRLPLEPRTSRPRYMIDYEMYKMMHSEDNEHLSAHEPESQLLDLLDGEDSPDDRNLLLLPAFIHGYSLHDKDWRNLDVSFVEDAPWDVDAFEKGLVFDRTKKNAIKALVSVHMETAKSADIIEGKGNGLIILLHGGPGTGKTLTAESVAELAKKPLYRVTCGDMGVDAVDVEKYLNSVFHIGTAWDCVVLLDEADVFLEERTQFDLKRNALVSVFLRVLEYFEGILILTTNRIGTFDEAFKSRIQLAVHYPPLKKSDRRTIWRYGLEHLYSSHSQYDVELLMDKLDDLAEHELNGRQIRNIVNSALQLAHYGGAGLDYSHFEQIIRIVTEFEEYVHKAKGEIAEQHTRASMFGIVEE